MPSFNEYLTHGNAWLFIPAAIVLGALHGFEPGHSKTMMAAFIIAIRGTVSQAALLGLSATISHTAVIWALAAVGLTFSGRLNVEELEPYFQVATGAIVLGMAVWMLRRTRREQLAVAEHHEQAREHGPNGGTMIATGHGWLAISVFETNVPPRFRLHCYNSVHQALKPRSDETVTLETIRPDGSRQMFSFAPRADFWEATDELPEPHEFKAAVTFAHGGHTHRYETAFVEDHHHHDHTPHDHGHHHHDASHLGLGTGEYQDEHERAHASELEARFAKQQVTTWQIVLFGLTGGLMPCPAAFAVLLVCLQLKDFTLGFALVLAFSVGLAITLVSVGALAALSVREASRRFKGFGELARKLPYASSAVLTLVGLFIAIQGMRGILR